MIQINKPAFAASRVVVARLVGISLISVCLWTSAIAQDNARVEHNDQSEVERLSDQATSQRTNTISPGLSMFFIVGIAINVIVIALFTVWFTRQWNRKRNSGDRE